MTRSGRTILVPVAIVLAFAQSTAGQVSSKEFLTRDGNRPRGLFAPGIAIDKTVYIAGKGDYRPDEEFSIKVENCLNEIRKTLQRAGLDLQHVVKSFVYLEDSDKYGEFNEHYAKFFPNDPPARTTLGVARVPGPSRLEITCIAYSDSTSRKQIGAPPAGFPFSPGILAGETLYISGKGDHLPGGGHPEGFEEQVRQAMHNVETTLEQAGLDFRHVVMSHVFLDKRENLAIARKVYGEFFKAGDEPAAATVLVDWIPGGSHVEITCIATTDLSARKVVRLAGAASGPTTAAVAASPGVWAGNTLYLSALSGLSTTDGAPDSVAVGEQVHQMASSHVATLEAAGLALEDIVSGCVYLRDIDHYKPMNAVYRQYFSRGPGVRTCLMPSSVSGIHEESLVQASFIAARTR